MTEVIAVWEKIQHYVNAAIGVIQNGGSYTDILLEQILTGVPPWAELLIRDIIRQQVGQ